MIKGFLHLLNRKEKSMQVSFKNYEGRTQHKSLRIFTEIGANMYIKYTLDRK